jgi:hypothetical protein
MVAIAPSKALAGQRWNTPVALGAGAVFVVLGLAGFLVSGGHHAAGSEGGQLLGVFQVNLLHNVVHITVGAVMVAAGIVGTRQARTANTTIGVIYLALFVAGLFLLDTAANILALNGADNVLHLVLGLVLTAVGTGADRR